ncbi:winged helix-turn-helix domain-containing protein, partial [Muribaculum intestinale]|uniref:winged helix-turn-helix domain-containing protein n=1 Tax=Muribaculum intestinale TaxID=1796646 RepID=UPI00349E9965
MGLIDIFSNAGAKVITKSILLDRISEDTPDCTENSLKMHISNLRKKLRQPNG